MLRRHFQLLLSTRFAFAVAFTIFAITVSARAAEASQPVVGSLESVSSGGVAVGWALDLDSSTASISVQLYLDGPAGSTSGRFLGAVQASLMRTDIKKAGNHGFSFSIPSAYLDGRSHTLYVYGVDLSGMASETLLLSNAPLTFLAPASASPTRITLDNGTIRVGLETRCGGTLAELRYQGGPNLINNSDCTGRQVQAALYDGNDSYDACAGCSGVFGWNPVQGGDRYEQGSPIVTQTADSSSAHIVSRPLEWYPDNKGGGYGRPILSDVMIEQWTAFIPDHPNAVRLHYKITHLGSDTHANMQHEFPAVYVNLGFDRFVYYSGTEPWANAPVVSESLPPGSQPGNPRYIPEHWAALVNGQDIGLTIYTPRQYPYVWGGRFDGTSGEYGTGANYLRVLAPFTFLPLSVLEGDIFLIAGDYRVARNTITAIRNNLADTDFLPPAGWFDTPWTGQTIKDNVLVSGWALDDTRVSTVEVFVDGTYAGSGTYGVSRPDVNAVFPNAPMDVGFVHALDTTRYSNGSHTITVQVRDSSGYLTLFRKAVVTIDNAPTQPVGDTVAPAVRIVEATQRARDILVSVSAADDVGVDIVELEIDGQIVATDSTDPYSFQVRARPYRGSTIRLVARARDATGNVGVSVPVTLTVR